MYYVFHTHENFFATTVYHECLFKFVHIISCLYCSCIRLPAQFSAIKYESKRSQNLHNFKIFASIYFSYVWASFKNVFKNANKKFDKCLWNKLDTNK